MRPFLFEPVAGYTVDVIWTTLNLVMIDCVTEESIKTWPKLQRAIAYDWAIREHLHASDNTNIRRRDMPTFLKR